MGSSLQPVFSLSGPKVIDIVKMVTQSPWRQQPAVADWVTPLIENTCEKAKATRHVRQRAREFVFSPQHSHYFDSKDSSGPPVTFGVSASHEAGVTYLAFSNRAVAIDCCAPDRAGQILSAGQEAFARAELEMLVSQGQLVHGWCAVECLCKLWGAGILQPSARPRLMTISPMTAEGTEFGSIGDVEQDRTRSVVCVWATKTPSTSREGVA